ncbi:MAG: ParB family transcriptional regulator, chromosome partitioning protein [Deferribacteres bacterium]|jgi:ParB family chromosome partitioning protein|nr:ParB family transcriptional regulator, chromosome partitioning protein [Deferribacteres bacterium]
MRKNPLGRGLESLIPKDNSVNKKGPVELDITDIIPNEKQPRRIFDSEKLNELAESIKSKGLIQPIVVTKHEDKYLIIAGERRWRACGLAGLKKIPVIIKDINDEKERLELALIENIQREDLNPIEVANAYKSLMEKFSYTQEELSKIVGKSRSAVANILRLLKLPHEITEALSKNIISEGHARALLGLDDHLKVMEAFNTVVKKKLSVRETENLVKRIKTSPAKKMENSGADIFVESIKKEFESFFKTKVNIRTGKKGGTIEIKYSSNEELDTIINHLRGQI